MKGQSISAEEAKKQGEEFAARAGKKIDGTVSCCLYLALHG